MDIEISLKKLFSLHKFGIKLGLDNIIGFLNHLGNPQNKLKCIHVAGSNGKGSTSSFISSILQEFGFRIGLYTSPHFVKFNERVAINGIQIDDEYISNFISEHENYIDSNQLTFFEVTTAMAFQYFSDMKTDYCVIETGLGGRLDATNVFPGGMSAVLSQSPSDSTESDDLSEDSQNPLAVVITTISLEHTNVLGNTLEQIAGEKAAIIKNYSNVIIGILKNEARTIIQKKCAETNSTLFRLADFISENGNDVDLNLSEIKIPIKPPLKGKYQKINAALASLCIAKTFKLIETQKYLAGISNVSINTGLQGRYEYYHLKPTIIFDSAHNPEGIEKFLNQFALEAKSYKKRSLIFGVMRDKEISQMLEQLSQYFDEIHLSKIHYERAAQPEELSVICQQLNIAFNILNEPVNFIQEFKKLDGANCLVVLGSMYLLGEIKQQLLKVNA